MPFMYFALYMVAETLTFWAVSKWIGVGWALIALFVTMFFGMSIAGLEVRRLMGKQVERTGDGTYVVRGGNVGKTASNVGLTLVGGMLLSLPGFLTTILGALFIFSPTRAVFRTVMAASLYRKIENMGVKIYEATPMAQQHDSYGDFGSFGRGQATQSGHPSTQDAGPHEVLDEEEIRRWSENLDPDDFGPSGGESKGGKS